MTGIYIKMFQFIKKQKKCWEVNGEPVSTISESGE